MAVKDETAILKVALSLSTTNFRKQFNNAIAKTSNVLNKELTIQKKLLDIESKKSIAKRNEFKSQAAYTASLRQVALLEKSIADKKNSVSRLGSTTKQAESPRSITEAYELSFRKQKGLNSLIKEGVEISNKQKPTSATEATGYLNPQNISKIRQLSSEYNVLRDSIGRAAPATKAARDRLFEFQKTAALTNTEMTRLNRSTRTFNFDFLTLMFAGQMLQRTFGGAIKSIVTDFNRLTEHQSAFGMATRNVSANFNYLKFAIGNALNNPMIVDAVEWLADGIQYVADVIDENPELAITIMAIMGAMAAIGIAAQIASAVIQVGMMGDAVKKLVTHGGGKGAISTINFLKALSLVGTITIGTITFNDTLEITTDEKTKLVDRLINIGEWGLLGATFGFFLGGVSGGLLGLKIGLGLGVLVNAIDFSLEDNVSGTGNGLVNSLLKMAMWTAVGVTFGFFLFGGLAGATTGGALALGAYIGLRVIVNAIDFLFSDDVDKDTKAMDAYLSGYQGTIVDVPQMELGFVDGYKLPEETKNQFGTNLFDTDKAKDEFDMLDFNWDNTITSLLDNTQGFNISSIAQINDLVASSNESFTTMSTDFAGRTTDMQESFEKFEKKVDDSLAKSRTMKIDVEYNYKSKYGGQKSDLFSVT